MRSPYPLATIWLFVLVLTACDDKTPVPDRGAACPANNKGSTALAQGASRAAICDTSKPAQEDMDEDLEAVPTFTDEKLDPRFNRNTLPKVKLPDGYDKKTLIAKKSVAARPIWLDVAKRKTKADISIWQPLPRPSLISQTDDLVSFYLAGHVAIGTYKLRPGPEDAHLVVAFNVTRAKDQTFDRKALTSPKDYTLTFERISDLSEKSAFDECEKVFAKTGSEGLSENYFYCLDLLNGLGYGSYNPTTNQYNNAFGSLYQKQSVAVWKATCPDNYVSLGMVSTNGQKPFSVQDFSQSIFDGSVIPPVKAESAMYCVKKDYTVEGKLQETPVMTVGPFKVYKIVAADEQKGISGNMFYATSKSLPLPAEEKVYVLSKEHTIELQDD